MCSWCITSGGMICPMTYHSDSGRLAVGVIAKLFYSLYLQIEYHVGKCFWDKISVCVWGGGRGSRAASLKITDSPSPGSLQLGVGLAELHSPSWDYGWLDLVQILCMVLQPLSLCVQWCCHDILCHCDAHYLFLLHSLCPIFHDDPWALGRENMMYIYSIEVGTPIFCSLHLD